MRTALLKTSSKKDFELLAELAEKLGITFKVLSPEETEDIGMYHAMKQRTGKNTDVDKFLKKLKGA